MENNQFNSQQEYETPQETPTDYASESCNYADSEPDYKKERKNAGCFIFIALAVLCLVLFAVLCGILAKSFRSFDWDKLPIFTSAPTATATLAPDSSAGIPAITPSYPETTPRVLPQFDGKLPTIGNSANPFPDIIDAYSKSVVGIYNYTDYNGSTKKDVVQGSGTGFIISSEGYVVTNAHVINGASRITVVMNDDTELKTELIGYDNTSDIAVLKFDNSKLKLPALVLGNSSRIRVGDFVIIIGDPSGRELAGSASFGIISATNRELNIEGKTNKFIQTDAAVNPGNSGGPLINMNGEVIGVVSAKTLTASYDEFGNEITAEGLGFAIPINDALNIITSLISDGHIQRPGIGITVTTLNEERRAELKAPQGVYVYSVTEDGPGKKAGLETGDVIVEVEGVTDITQDAFISLIKAKKVGDSIKLKYWRNGSYHDAVVTIGDLNLIG